MLVMFGGLYQNKRVFLTGHTGFKGSWMSLWLHQLGARVFGYALPPRSSLDLYHILSKDTFEQETLADLRDQAALELAITQASPDLIIHMAAQPLVRESYVAPLETFSVNAWGTALLLETVRSIQSPAHVIVVTSDKCYLNHNHGRPFTEGDPLGGHDVYSMSKAATEMVTAAWHSSFFARESERGRLATVRAGNVIGGGDYAPDRILPDCVRAQIAGQSVVLRNPGATRPWQHVLECLSGYLSVGQHLFANPASRGLLNLNFGPDSESERSVSEVVAAFFDAWPGHWAERPDPMAPPEAHRLTLNHGRASQLLGWHPAWDFKTATRNATDWYRARHTEGDSDMLALTRHQISEYYRHAQKAGLSWTS